MEHSNWRYKEKVDRTRRHKDFPIGYEAMIHFKKERFPFGF